MYILTLMKDKDLDGILFDFERSERIGLPEAVFCEKKPLAVLEQLLQRFANGEPPILFTRLWPEVYKNLPGALTGKYDYDPISATAYAATLPSRTKGRVAVISAGMADAYVATEAARTLKYLGIEHSVFNDCGISALWRIMERIKSINTHDALIVVAGMEGALASVIGGLSSKPIFAVPTSVGYGISAGGNAALSGMLASCAPGISVLNIDNGYGAACAAARVVNLL